MSFEHKFLLLIKFVDQSMKTYVQDTNDGRGRGIFCQTNVNYGEEIVRERAKTLWISRSYYKTECGFCLKHFPLNEKHESCYSKSCLKCCRISYCSLECEKLDENEHKYVCNYLQSIYCKESSKINAKKWTEEEDSCLHLCVKVLYLLHNYPHLYNEVITLYGDGVTLDEDELNCCNKVFSLIQTVFPSLKHPPNEVNVHFTLSLEWVIDLFKKDKSCGFAIMQPPEVRFNVIKKQSNQYNDITKQHEQYNTSSNNNSNSSDIDQHNSNSSDIQFKKLDKLLLGVNIEQTASEDSENDTESTVRGYGLFSYLGIINHSCMPNCVRWDNFDHIQNDVVCNNDNVTNPDHASSNDVYFRALVPLTPNTEVLQSYVPISWDYNERQEYLYEMFGFKCTCIRCQTESLFESNDDDEDDDYDEEEEEEDEREEIEEIEPKNKNRDKEKTLAMTSSSSVPANVIVTQADELQYNMIQVYLSRHMCPNDQCSGILTPVPPFSGSIESFGMNTTSSCSSSSNLGVTDMYQCNVCYEKRSHQEFLNMLHENI